MKDTAHETNYFRDLLILWRFLTSTTTSETVWHLPVSLWTSDAKSTTRKATDDITTRHRQRLGFCIYPEDRDAAVHGCSTSRCSYTRWHVIDAVSNGRRQSERRTLTLWTGCQRASLMSASRLLPAGCQRRTRCTSTISTPADCSRPAEPDPSERRLSDRRTRVRSSVVNSKNTSWPATRRSHAVTADIL